MRPFIVIRQYESADSISRKELIRKYALSFAFDAFMSCLFREVQIREFFLLCNEIFNQTIVISFVSVWFVVDFHSTGCAGGCCDVHFLWFPINHLLMFTTTCCYFHLCFCIWGLFHQSTRIVKCKFGSIYLVREVFSLILFISFFIL